LGAGAFVVVLHDTELKLFSAGSRFELLQALQVQGDFLADDMSTLDDNAVLALMTPKGVRMSNACLHWYTLRDDKLVFAGKADLTCSGVLCRVSSSLACVGQSAPARLTFWDAKQRCAHVHRFQDEMRTAVIDLVPVSDNLFCVLSFDRAHVCRISSGVDGEITLNLDVVLQTPSTARISCAVLVRDSLLCTFDHAGAVAVFDIDSAARVAFRRHGFEVPSCNALPCLHTRTVCQGDRVVHAWRIDDTNAQVRTRLWPSLDDKHDSDSILMVMLSSGQLQSTRIARKLKNKR
jgi:hypothetical protein